jgi:hypothetical protein
MVHLRRARCTRGLAEDPVDTMSTEATRARAPDGYRLKTVAFPIVSGAPEVIECLA